MSSTPQTMMSGFSPPSAWLQPTTVKEFQQLVIDFARGDGEGIHAETLAHPATMPRGWKRQRSSWGNPGGAGFKKAYFANARL
eukprot:9409911-Pyramimonas_sp.AAC.1